MPSQMILKIPDAVYITSPTRMGVVKNRNDCFKEEEQLGGKTDALHIFLSSKSSFKKCQPGRLANMESTEILRNQLI